MITAIDVSEWFIHWAESDGEDAESTGMTNMKLQKLLYYAQGHFLGQTGKPLFEDKIQAWSHGPVVVSSYHRYKDAGKGPVTSHDENFTWDKFSDEESTFLSSVWNTFGGLTAARLRNMSHDESPWKDAWRDDERGTVITTTAIRDHFSKLYAAP